MASSVVDSLATDNGTVASAPRMVSGQHPRAVFVVDGGLGSELVHLLEQRRRRHVQVEATGPVEEAHALDGGLGHEGAIELGLEGLAKEAHDASEDTGRRQRGQHGPHEKQARQQPHVGSASAPASLSTTRR